MAVRLSSREMHATNLKGTACLPGCRTNTEQKHGLHAPPLALILIATRSPQSILSAEFWIYGKR